MKSNFAFHEGEALYRLASIYPRLLDVLLEIVQNAIDMNATMIMLGVNQKTRLATVRDNGEGATQARFEAALLSVGKGIKSTDKLGRFGIGLVSPLGKCERFSFTSTPKSDPRGYLEWKFVTEELRAQQKISGIPMQVRKDLQFTRGDGSTVKGITSIPWRTEVRMEHYTNDSQINRVSIDSLRDGILVRFGPSMRRNKVVVIVTITDENGNRSTQEIRAEDFAGTKLKEVDLHEADSGRSVFRLFLARKADKGRKGKVLVGEYGNDYRLDFSTFVRNLPDACEFSDEVLSALKSGFFEGEILNTRIRLNANRKSFEANDALLGFCVAIEKWYKEVGHEYFKEALEQKAGERYQRLGVCSMKVFEGLLKDPAYAGYLKVIESFKQGSIGLGHTKHKGKVSSVTSVSVHGNTGQTITQGKGNGESKHSPEFEKPDHHPLTVVGPKGSRRVTVRSNSLGLQLMHEPMVGSDNLWVLDEDTGTLRINVLHPLWQQCEDHSDRTIMRFQEYIMLQALGLKMAGDWETHARLVLDDMMKPYVYILINGDSLAGRQPGRHKVVTENDEKSSSKSTVTPTRKRA